MTRVLVVDDDTSTVRLISLLLRTEGIGAIQTHDGSEALRVLRRVHPDAIILDLQLPRIDGWALYKEAREAGYDGPVVVCTALDARSARKELGADAYIQKPFDPDDLVKTVKTQITKHEPKESPGSNRAINGGLWLWAQG